MTAAAGRALAQLTVHSRPIAPAPTLRPRTEHEEQYQRMIDALYGPYLDFPRQVGLETLARCNASCDFCPYPTMTRKGMRMSDDLIAKALRDLRDMPQGLEFEFYPVRVNEPFLDVRLFDILSEVNRTLPAARPCLFTNASVLTDALLDKLCNVERIKILNLSFNDHRKEQYERVMKLSYDRTLPNIDRLHARWRSGEVKAELSISRVAEGNSADDDFRAFVQQRWPGVEVWIMPRNDWMGSVETKASRDMPPTGCRQWFGIHFLASGKDAFCCTDHDAAFGVGNLADTHILELYNHPRRRSLRERVVLRQDVRECTGCASWA